MICDRCGKPATYFLTENDNGFITEKHLCDSCVKKLENQNSDKQLNVGNFLDTLNSTSKTQNKVCEVCGSTYEDVIESGFVGCSHCYEVFADDLYPLIHRIQGSLKHIGKLPMKKQSAKDKELIRLNFELEKAVNERRYEDAGKIDEEIRKLEGDILG